MRLAVTVLALVILWSIVTTVDETCGDDFACRVAMEAPQ